MDIKKAEEKVFTITPDLLNEISINVIKKLFKNLNPTDSQTLLKYTILLINTIAIKFNWLNDSPRKKQIYTMQLRQNDYRDVKSLLLMILPYIDDDSSDTKKSNLKSFEEMYVAKTNNTSTNDISKTSPQYTFTNLQYNRNIRSAREDNNSIITSNEVKFSIEHLEHNMILLLDTIQIIANRLFVNWINVTPVNPQDVTNLEVYRETQFHLLNDNLLIWDPHRSFYDKADGFTPRDTSYYYSGLPVSEIYNTISNYFYHTIKSIKWTIYDIYIDKQPYKFVYLLNKLISLNNPLNVPYENLPQDQRTLFSQGTLRGLFNDISLLRR